MEQAVGHRGIEQGGRYPAMKETVIALEAGVGRAAERGLLLDRLLCRRQNHYAYRTRFHRVVAGRITSSVYVDSAL